MDRAGNFNGSCKNVYFASALIIPKIFFHKSRIYAFVEIIETQKNMFFLCP